MKYGKSNIYTNIKYSVSFVHSHHLRAAIHQKSVVLVVKVCDKSAAGFRRFCDLLTTENDVISEKET